MRFSAKNWPLKKEKMMRVEEEESVVAPASGPLACLFAFLLGLRFQASEPFLKILPPGKGSKVGVFLDVLDRGGILEEARRLRFPQGLQRAGGVPFRLLVSFCGSQRGILPSGCCRTRIDTRQ